MTDELSKAAFESDLEDAKQADDAFRWSFDRRADLEVWVTVSPRGHDSERFVARLAWNRYPDAWPSVQFVDPETGKLNAPKAWPTGRGFRPPNDICATWTAEGHAIHPEWANDPRYKLVAHGNMILRSVRTLQGELDESFQGRFKG